MGMSAHIWQTTNAHGITVMYHMAPPLTNNSSQEFKVSLQAHCIYREGCWD